MLTGKVVGTLSPAARRRLFLERGGCIHSESLCSK